MKFKDLVKELEESDTYKEFIDQHPESFLAAGFFILDLKNSKEQIQLDFFLPKEQKIAGFEYPFSKFKIFEDKIVGMKSLSTDLKIDIGDLETKCKEIIERNESKLVPTKIIAVLRDNIWNLTCMDEMLGIIRIHIDAITGKEISFDKGSLMDFMGIRKGKS